MVRQPLHNNLTGLGGKKDFAVHQLGHALGAMFDVAHGASLSAVWRAWAEEVAGADGYARFARFARNVWDVAEADDAQAARQGIEKQVAFFRSIGMPVSLPELAVGGLDDAVMDRWRHCAATTTAAPSAPSRFWTRRPWPASIGRPMAGSLTIKNKRRMAVAGGT